LLVAIQYNGGIPTLVIQLTLESLVYTPSLSELFHKYNGKWVTIICCTGTNGYGRVARQNRQQFLEIL